LQDIKLAYIKKKDIFYASCSVKYQMRYLVRTRDISRSLRGSTETKRKKKIHSMSHFIKQRDTQYRQKLEETEIHASFLKVICAAS